MTIKILNSTEEEKTKKIILSKYTPLIIKISKKFSGRDCEVEDLMQEGYYGLLKAIDKFDESKNIKFITYAYYWIYKYIREFYYFKSSVIRYPEEVVRMHSSRLKEIENEEEVTHDDNEGLVEAYLNRFNTYSFEKGYTNLKYVDNDYGDHKYQQTISLKDYLRDDSGDPLDILCDKYE